MKHLHALKELWRLMFSPTEIQQLLSFGKEKVSNYLSHGLISDINFKKCIHKIPLELTRVWVVQSLLGMLTTGSSELPLLPGDWPCSQCVASQLSWLSIALVSRRSQFRILLKPWYFAGFLLPSNCLNWKIYCDDHSSLSSTTAVQYFTLLILLDIFRI